MMESVAELAGNVSRVSKEQSESAEQIIKTVEGISDAAAENATIGERVEKNR